ncbi:hypothetical protein GCM10010151_25830 [Actinoallomurus spadix]|uniref:Uncharacterized protein n=1 Tax=Actinoallomurus spadix TaxID=79912 RepID=A0ABN0Z1K7_9ACTN
MQARLPQHVLLQDDEALTQPFDEEPGHGRLAAAAGAGERQQGKPGERLPMTAHGADDDRRLGDDMR